MNKTLKVLSLVLVLVVCFSLPALAANIDLDQFTSTEVNISELNTLGSTIIGVLQVVATIVAIAVLLFIGIKYLLAAPGEKANIKTVLVPYLIGAILIFATVPILEIFQSFAKQL